MITVFLVWALRVIVVMFVLRLLLRALFPRGIGAPAGGTRRTGNARNERIGGELVRDPQCGTYVPKARAVVVGSGEKALYFCSTTCRDMYRKKSA